MSEQVTHRPVLELICPYEQGRPIDQVQRELGLQHVVKLASNENPLGPSPRVLDALLESTLCLHRYPDSGATALREDLARELGVTPRAIALGAGSAEVMRHIADAFLERGDEGIVADVCFPVYSNVIRIAGALPIEVPLTGSLDYDLQRVLDSLTTRTRVVFLASPNNPTGRAIPQYDLVAFLERLPPGVLCCLDLAYHEYADHSIPDLASLIRQFPNLVILRTFSKVYGLAALRIGYAFAAEQIIQWLERVRIPFSISGPAQSAARAALQDKEHVVRSVELNHTMRRLLDEQLAALGGHVFPSLANFVLVDLARDSGLVFNEVLRRGVIVRPVRHPRLRTCVRITTGTETEVHTLLNVLSEVLLAHSPLPQDSHTRLV